MASTSQLKANRANAKHSTGPKSASGKLKSRYNALKHGLSAQQIVIGEEEPTEFDALLNALIEDCAPVSALELELVEQLASIIWRIRRIPRLEVAIIEYHRAEISKMQPDQSYDGIRRAELAKKALCPKILS